ncbi:hypothetical protein [Anditalea andensis]|uniref:Uncharacterized protein n=1 Tax=Anditalea andensis TaxID=1048983 RepID=A0A074KTV0_9BACT|nr:hypothetical protein [Anditalea andensis]KEO71670.1 hypothetical protein EL17_23460 [Anditalea andensis]
MKIIIPTSSGESLKTKIFKFVEDENLKTWVIRIDSKSEKYLTHKPNQWYDLALIEFIVLPNQLEAKIAWWDNNEPTDEVKGYYIGRFVEILLVHFKDNFKNFSVNK